MKFSSAISATAAILFLALGVVSLLLDYRLRELRITVAGQQHEERTAEGLLADQTRAAQELDDQGEALEQQNEALRRKIVQQQLALDAQQEQINQGLQIAQQVGPNLLHDLAGAAGKNEKIKALLTAHGYTIQTR